jgi:hypothetical protein
MQQAKMKKECICLFLAIIINIPTQAQIKKNMKNIFKAEQQTHLALTQYYRWYQVYEVPFTAKRIQNQKDILSNDVEIISSLGTSKGTEQLEDRLKVYEGWKNAHHVQHTDVKLMPDGNIALEADIIYQNIRPDQSKFRSSANNSLNF